MRKKVRKNEWEKVSKREKKRDIERVRECKRKWEGWKINKSVKASEEEREWEWENETKFGVWVWERECGREMERGTIK